MAEPTVLNWLECFAQCVRLRDIEAGKALFSPEVYSFGTRAEVVDNLEELATYQWQPIWFNTREFRFLKDSIKAIAADDHSLVCVSALWESYGMEESQSDEPQSFIRRGRCTLVLKKNNAAPYGYLAIHSHFSKVPVDRL